MNYKSFHFLLKVALALYLIALVWVLFYQVGGTHRDSSFDNPDDHLLPFHSTYDMLKNAFAYRHTSHRQEFREILLFNIMGNLLLLLPWGILAPLVFKKLNTLKAVALSGFLISLTAETLQFILKVGVFDIDDLMYNTLGAVIGFYIGKSAKYFLGKKTVFGLPGAEDKALNQNRT